MTAAAMLDSRSPDDSTASAVDWSEIDTVCLDMDGTVLDLHFDNHFWLEAVPRRYSQLRGVSPEDAWSQIVPRFEARRGTLEWYCIEHWSSELGIDIEALKRELAGHIRWLPGAEDFLARLASFGTRRLLVTNAHPKSLAIKSGHTGLAAYFDALVSSHSLGAPKESPEFWERLLCARGIDRDSTLFVDDSPPVLKAARACGVRWLFQVLQPDSTQPARPACPGIRGIRRVADLLDSASRAVPALPPAG